MVGELKKRHIVLVIVIISLVVVLLADVQASAFGQLQQQAAGQNCFDEGCSGDGGTASSSTSNARASEEAVFSSLSSQLRTAGTNFFSNLKVLKKELLEPLFYRNYKTNTQPAPTGAAGG